MDSSRFCGIICREELTPISSNQGGDQMDATTIAVDLAKNVFEVAVANHQWRVVRRHRFTRTRFEQFLHEEPAAHIVMEACGSAHHWARTAQRFDHRVTLLPSQYVRPYVRRHKTDRTDAEALLEAIRSGRIPAVGVKTVTQQEVLALHRMRAQWMTTRTARLNAMRGLLLEHGIAVACGARTIVRQVGILLAGDDSPLPRRLRAVLTLAREEIRDLEARVHAIERELTALAADDPVIQRLMRIPGIGLLTATALVATVGHIHAFGRARRFASWLGLTPREWSSGKQRHLGAITKQGDVYLRCLLTHGARAVLVMAHRATQRSQPLTRLQEWALTVQRNRGHNKATVAVANKLARIIWVVWSRDVEFTSTPATAAAA
jgi:transposase